MTRLVELGNSYTTPLNMYELDTAGTRGTMRTLRHTASRVLMVRALVVTTLLFASGSACSQQPGLTPAESADKQPSKTSPIEQIADDKQRGSDESPLVVRGQVTATVKAEITTTKSAEEAGIEAKDREAKSANDRTALRLTLISAVATVLLTAITGALAFFTWKLWRETGNLVKGAAKHAEMQLRAYVNVHNAYAEWEKGTDILIRAIRISVTTRNSGQTPAHAVASWITAISRPRDNTEFPPPPNAGVDSIGVHAPRQKNLFEFVYQPPEPFNADEVQIWKSGKRSLFVYGRIDYRDVFGEPRYTEFRLVMPPNGVGTDSGKFTACKDGNTFT